MCGIFGSIPSEYNEEMFEKIMVAMRHRGPDDRKIYFSREHRLVLGHLRLSIIDPDERSSQPMSSSNGELIVVFNGEIYNYLELKEELKTLGYVFSTNSDTEVLLNSWQKWGLKCLEKLNGMFAFAIYDRRSNTLFTARDRMGEKPFYFSNTSNGFYFASELKALIAMQAGNVKIDFNAFDEILSYGFVHGSKTIFQDCKKLLPGQALSLNLENNEISTWIYWSPPASNQESKYKEDILHNELEGHLTDAVSKQLVADVPLGVLLSGGLDSSIITALASKSRTGIQTYTVGFPGSHGFDESIHAKKIADYFNTQHTVLQAEEVDINELKLLARQFDEPMTDPSLVPTYLLCKLVRQFCKVALGGDGADELFGGYHRYQEEIRLANRIHYLPGFVKKGIAAFATHILPLGYPGRYTLQTVQTNFQNEIPWQATLFDNHYRKKLLRKNDILPLNAEYEFRNNIVPGYDVADRAMRNDLDRYLPDDILVKSDRTSMLASLELRAPFLDRGVVEFALLKVPSSYKVNGTERKILLKKLAKKLLPTDYDFDRKQGFVPPLEKWFKSKEWKAFMLDHLLLGNDTWFNPKIIEQLWKGQEKGYYNKRRIFTLLMIELWRKEYNVNLTA